MPMGHIEHHRFPPTSSPAVGSNVTTRRHRFLSLKWKALLLTSLVLIIITGAFATISYVNLIKQFDHQRQATRTNDRQQIAALLAQASRRQQQIGGLLPLLSGMESSILADDSKAIHDVLNQHGSMLQIDMGIDLIRLYDSASRPTARWGTLEPGVNSTGLAREWVRMVNAKEQPQTYLDCSRACMQYTLLPMLIDGETVGVALLGVSLADVILAFNQVSGTDVALLSNAVPDQQAESNAPRNIAAWQMAVMASTNSDLVVPVLHALARRQPDISAVADGKRVYFQNRYYEASLTALPGFVNADNGYLVMVDDISSSLEDINGAISQHLAMGVLGLLLSEALLLALLWKPMSHLRRTALTLPLLARNAFEDVRQAIHKNTHRWTDEIDVLDEMAISLSHQLEGLNLEVEKRSRMLAERMHELARERDFVTNLLETAQVIILTQNSRGEIITLNRYGEALTFYQKNELKGVRFVELIGATTAPTVQAKLMEVAAGEETQFRHEAVTLRKDRTARDIVWLHSRLLGHSEADPVMLSVGLDITDRKRAELALQKIHGQLEIRVCERTQQLTEANQLLLKEISERKRVEQALAERAEALKQSEQSLRSQTEILQSILDSMADGVIVADQDGELLLSNPAAWAMSGHDSARLGVNRAGRPASLYLADGVTPYANEDLPVSRAIRGEEVDGAEAFLRHVDQTDGIWLSANARPLKDGEGMSRGAVVVFRDISERRQNEQRLAYLAQHDLLTGLPNRHLLQDRLHQGMVRARRSARLMALMFLDIDRFKEINDAFGHGAGDAVLKTIAQRLTAALRESDTVGRLGGDEFTVIVEDMDTVEYVSEVAEKIISAFATPLMIEEREVMVTTSIGIALYPADADTADEMLKKADIAMYHAKRCGRNRYQVYTSRMVLTPATA